MTKNTVVRAFLSVVVAVCALATGAVYLGQQADAQNVVCYREQGGAKTVAASGCEYEFRSGSTLDMGGALVLSQQSETVTAGFSLTPTSPYVVLSSSAVVTSSTATGIVTTTATAGQVVILRNGNASNAIVIDGTGGTVECKANVSLGAGDTLTLIYNGAGDWNCVSSYDNS